MGLNDKRIWQWRWNGYPYMTNERVREKCLEICRSSSERKSMESKPRILYLQKILLERTDEENMLSTTQLINILNDEYGISAHRTTITKDIALFRSLEWILLLFIPLKVNTLWQAVSLSYLSWNCWLTAVESSKFITSKKSDALIEKIHTMTSAGQVEKLRRNNYVVNRIKPDNEQIYYIIDTINEAINSGKQISSVLWLYRTKEESS